MLLGFVADTSGGNFWQSRDISITAMRALQATSEVYACALISKCFGEDADEHGRDKL